MVTPRLWQVHLRTPDRGCAVEMDRERAATLAERSADELAVLFEALGPGSAPLQRVAAAVRAEGLDGAAVAAFASPSACVAAIARAMGEDLSGVTLACVTRLVREVRPSHRVAPTAGFLPRMVGPLVQHLVSQPHARALVSLSNYSRGEPKRRASRPAVCCVAFGVDVCVIRSAPRDPFVRSFVRCVGASALRRFGAVSCAPRW